MRFLTFFTLFLACTPICFSQFAGSPVHPTEPEMAPHPIHQVFSFDMDGGLIFVQGEMEGKDDMFVLDTGAPTLVLNSSFFVSDLNGKHAVGISGRTNIQTLKIKTFRVGNTENINFTSFVTDLSHIEKIKKRRIKGLVGYEMLKGKEVMIDYENELLAFLDSEASVDEFVNKKVSERIDFKFRGHFPVVRVKIGKRYYHFGVDTGAEANIIDRRLKKKLKKVCDRQYTTLALQGIDPNKSSAEATKIKSISVNDIKFENLDFVFTDISNLNQGYKVMLDGILGAPFLKSQCFSINFYNKELKIWKEVPKDESFLVKGTKEVVTRKSQTN